MNNKLKILCVFGTRPEVIKMAPVINELRKHSGQIVKAVSELLDNKAKYDKMSKAVNPYGDGKASVRIAQQLSWKRKLMSKFFRLPKIMKMARHFLKPEFLESDLELNLAGSMIAFQKKSDDRISWDDHFEF